jgi:Uma2 family endonuclease
MNSEFAGKNRGQSRTVKRLSRFDLSSPGACYILKRIQMAYDIQTEARAASTENSGGGMTYAEFLNWPGANHHVEWVNGRMVFMSPVTEPHENIRGFLNSLIKIFAEAHHRGRVYSEPFQMKTGPDLPGRAPDVFFVANENLSRVKRLNLEGAADLVVEIISPGSRATDRGDKFYEYEQGGVPEYWLLDPERQQAEFYLRGEDGIYRLVPPDKDGLYHSKVLAGLWLKVEWLWQPQPPAIMDVLREWGLV